MKVRNRHLSSSALARATWSRMLRASASSLATESSPSRTRCRCCAASLRAPISALSCNMQGQACRLLLLFG